MSFLLVEPDLVTAAAANLAGIRSALSEAAAAASTPRPRWHRPAPMRCRRLSRDYSAPTVSNFKRSTPGRRRFTPSS